MDVGRGADVVACAPCTTVAGLVDVGVLVLAGGCVTIGATCRDELPVGVGGSVGEGAGGV